MRRCLLWVVSLSLGLGSAGGAQPQTRNILLLQSRDDDQSRFHTETFREELIRRSLEPLNVFTVSIQPAAFRAPQEQPVVDYIRSTLAGHRADLVVSTEGPAAVFARKYRPELFGTAPLLQIGVDARWVQSASFSAYETAVPIELDMAGMIEAMLHVLPDTTRIFVVIGASEFETFWCDALRREFERFTDRATFIWFNELSLPEMLERAAALPPHSAIFYPMLTVDAKGVLHSEQRALTQLHSVANAPIFGLYDTQLGRGIVGGPLVSLTDSARVSADVALRILSGESPRAIATPTLGHGPPTYDWRELTRWGISEARLPAGSIVRFRQPSVWDQYGPYIAAAAVVLALQSALIAGLVVQHVRRRGTELALRDSEQRFRETAEQNQDLAGRLIDAQEAERTRIARDLHDDLSQQLAGLSIMLSGLKYKVRKVRSEPEVDRAFSTLQDRASALAENVRNLSHELHPSVLQHAGLVPALRRHCGDLEQQHQITVTFSADENVDSLSAGVALCLFRVTQEALTNVVRHARARTIRVRLIAVNDGVELSVVDDGIGFDVGERTRSGLGLRSIDERVRLVRGHVTIESRPGEGTELFVRIPTAGHVELVEQS